MRTANPRSIRSLMLKLFFLLPMALVYATVAMAQTPPTTVFQLDGTAASNGSTCVYGTPCDYWNLLNGTGIGNNPGSAGHSSARTFVNGATSTDSFQGGGSKDPNPISSWSYSNSPTPNKDTFNHGYAAAYMNNGHLILAFGADRADASGDANIGIWFFQQKVEPDGSGGFTGAHADHDIFIVSAFTNGGGTPNFTVYEWFSSCNKSHYATPTALPACADRNLRELYNATTNCGSAITCAATNGGSIPTSWGGTLGPQTFFTGGVDISAVFAIAGVSNLPCFSSFLEETRSSQSTSAVLKDFLAGNFPVCGLSVTKICGTASLNAAGTSVTYPVSGVVTNTGVGALFSVTVSDVINGTTTHTVSVTNNTVSSSNFGSTTLGGGETGTWTDTSSSAATSESDVATASGSTSSGSGGTTVTSDPTNQITCSLSVNSALAVTKSCSTTLAATGSDVRVNVAFNGSVCNTGPSQITGLTLKDFTGTNINAAGVSITPATTTLGPCNPVAYDPVTKLCSTAGACTPFTGSYVPTTIDSTADNGRYFFDDLAVVTGATSTIGTLTVVSTPTDPRTDKSYGFEPATCPICDKNECVQ